MAHSFRLAVPSAQIRKNSGPMHLTKWEYEVWTTGYFLN